MTRRQCELVDDDATYMIVWLPTDSRIKQGVKLTLKELPGVVWTVKSCYGFEVDEEYFHRKWNFDHMEKLPGLDLASKA